MSVLGVTGIHIVSDTLASEDHENACARDESPNEIFALRLRVADVFVCSFEAGTSQDTVKASIFLPVAVTTVFVSMEENLRA